MCIFKRTSDDQTIPSDQGNLIEQILLDDSEQQNTSIKYEYTPYAIKNYEPQILIVRTIDPNIYTITFLLNTNLVKHINRDRNRDRDIYVNKIYAVVESQEVKTIIIFCNFMGEGTYIMLPNA